MAPTTIANIAAPTMDRTRDCPLIVAPTNPTTSPMATATTILTKERIEPPFWYPD
jgi:hypothetical protein